MIERWKGIEGDRDGGTPERQRKLATDNNISEHVPF